MNDEDLNRKLHEAMGGCVHEFDPKSASTFKRLWECVKCETGRYSSFRENPKYTIESVEWIYPAYDSDISACLGEGGLVEFMRKRWAKQNPDETQFFRFTATDCCEHGWRVDIEWGHHGGDIPIADSVHESLSMAICLAAAAALGIREK